MQERPKSISVMRGTQWRSWLRHDATSRKVEGSIPYGVIGIFHSLIPCCRTVVPESTQPLNKINTSGISLGVKMTGIRG
jgi:hypothetical protein